MPLDRRTFLRGGAAALGAAGLGTFPLSAARVRAAPAVARPVRRQRLAAKLNMVEAEGSLLDRFRILADAGFDGIELDSPNAYDRAEVLAARDATGLVIHGVVDSAHWRQPLSDPDPAVRAAGLAALHTAIDDARAYGASTVLLVPAVVNKRTSYADAWARSVEGIREALPHAEEQGIRIAIENVWNGFLLSPLECARYLDGFASDHIGAYFDVGNVVNFGWPEHWIEALGPRILKLDIKEYSRAKRDEEGPYAGFRVPIGEGDCDWPAVRAALAAVGYEGWATAEVAGGDAAHLADVHARMAAALNP